MVHIGVETSEQRSPPPGIALQLPLKKESV
jgi:hypothetical protein